MLTKLLLPILLLLIQTAPSEAGQDGWDKIITGLAEFDGPAFRDEVAEPLVQMSANAYRCPEVIDVPRWILSSKVALVAPAGGGMHAVVYEVSKIHTDYLGFRHLLPLESVYTVLLWTLHFEMCGALM